MSVFNYAEQFEQELQQKYARELTSFALTQSNPSIKFINAQTIKLPKISVTGYKDHNRNTMGFNAGTVLNDWEPKKLTHDRDIEIPIDPMDIDEIKTCLNPFKYRKYGMFLLGMVLSWHYIVKFLY